MGVRLELPIARNVGGPGLALCLCSVLVLRAQGRYREHTVLGPSPLQGCGSRWRPTSLHSFP